MSLPLLLLPKAKEDIRDQLAYLAEYGEDLVEKLIDALEDTFAHLAQFPQSGKLRFYYHPRLKNIRQWPVKGFRKLLIFYRADDTSLVVIRLLHSARDVDFALLDA